MSLEGLDASILLPAFAAGLLVLATHVPLGREVLARGIIFMDLAVAQIAGLGVVLGHVLGWGGGLAVQAMAFGAAVLGALLLSAFERRLANVQEAFIGTAFVLAASAALLVVAQDPHAAGMVGDLLAGQVLWVDWSRLGPVAVLYAVLLALWFGRPGWRRGPRFYVLFALAITASVQLVGVYLVFASLIIPALAVHGRGGAWLAAALGVAAWVAGLVIAALADLPAGPAIVWTLAAAALVTGLALRGQAPRGQS